MAAPNGWVALAGTIISNADIDFAMVYNWDEIYHPTKKEAIKAGYELAHDTDDFNLGQVVDGELVWFGWMDDKHPVEDYAEVAEQFGWSSPEGGES